MPKRTIAKRFTIGRLSFWADCAIACVFLSALFAAPARAQTSPGPLSGPHQSLSGVLSCGKCHEFGSGAFQLKCLDCHTEIRDRIAQRRGMHAFWVPTNATGKDCVTCHSEHNGTNFPLIRWQPSPQAMDHARTGFPLTGGHAHIACNKCHNAENIPTSARAGIMMKDLNRTFLGLTRDCVSCHTDEHRGQVGQDCGRCHTADAWKPASKFNHANTKYPLTGAHETVACAKCHVSIPDAKPYVKYTGLSFEKCTGCHADPHKGSFTAPCESCHNTTSWTSVAQLEGFDHSKTDYPLVGRHRTVACSDCHTHGDFKAPVAHAQCVDCHTPDPHKGQFQSRASKGECAECHTLDGWKPSLFGVKEHATSAYPLLGKHAEVECSKCHIPAGSDTVFKVKFGQCTDCHKDAHDGQFAKAPYENRCETCHTVMDFHRTRFTVAMHQATRYPLEGAHAVVPCIGCHKASASGRIDNIMPFHFEDQSCTACHTDPHNGQFKDRMGEIGSNGKPLGCEACHNVESWIDAKGFDHSKTQFPLLGAHNAVACSSCHQVPAGARKAVFRGTPKECQDCHADAHGGQFAKNKVTLCKDCHNSERWTPSTFDHDKRTSLPLTGGHANVSCDACHKQTQPIGDEDVIVYSLAPTKCADCHTTPERSVSPLR